MNTKTITLPLLCTFALPLNAGCDLETEDSMSLVSEAEDDELSEPIVAEAGGELALEPDAAASITYANTYKGLGRLDTLADGDIVMIENYHRGYLGCIGGTPEFDQAPHNIDNYAWRVHEVDLDGDGNAEFQFELIDGSGFTNTYLKMNAAGTVFCGTIGGIGDAAAWHEDAFDRTGGGTHYRKAHVQLQNEKQGLCLQGSSSAAALSKSCGLSYWDMAFWVEVIA